MYIEDDELREIYSDSSGERIDRLESALVKLERDQNDGEAIKEFKREAHTLKGDARMLGLVEIESLAHRFEDDLEPIEVGNIELSKNILDRFYVGIEILRQLVSVAIGESHTAEELIDRFTTWMDREKVLPLVPTTVNTSIESFSFAQLDLPELIVSNNSNNLDFKKSSAFDKFNPDLVDEGTIFDNNLSIFLDDIAMEASESHSTFFGNLPQDFELPISADRRETVADLGELTRSLDTSELNKNPPERIVSESRVETVRVDVEQLQALVRQASALRLLAVRSQGQERLYYNILTILNEILADRQQIIKLGGEFALLATSQQPMFDRLQELLGNLTTDNGERQRELDGLTIQLEKMAQELDLLPLSSVFNQFRRLVADLAAEQGKLVDFQIEGGDVRVDRQIREAIKDPLLHLLRNAIDHGIETPSERVARGKPATATLVLAAKQIGDRERLHLEIRDDGRGLDLLKIRATAVRKGLMTEDESLTASDETIQNLIFAAGFSTRTEVSAISGRGIGLDVVRDRIEQFNGVIRVDSSFGNGCSFLIDLLSQRTTRDILRFTLNSIQYGVPLDSLVQMLLVDSTQLAKGETTMDIAGISTPILWLADILDSPIAVPDSPAQLARTERYIPCIVLTQGETACAFLVDTIDDREVVPIQNTCSLLRNIPYVSGATIISSGDVCILLDPVGLIRSAEQRIATTTVASPIVNRQPHILLVEDSLVIRTQMIRILSGAGYQVTSAENGQKGWEQILSDRHFDGVVSDVEMPELDGISLTAKIRHESHRTALPVLLVTTLATDADRQRGYRAGANAYLTKGDFNQHELLATLNRLLP
jgi:two-component system chemotaxis sensor kinase CheA